MLKRNATCFFDFFCKLKVEKHENGTQLAFCGLICGQNLRRERKQLWQDMGRISEKEQMDAGKDVILRIAKKGVRRSIVLSMAYGDKGQKKAVNFY